MVYRENWHILLDKGLEVFKELETAAMWNAPPQVIYYHVVGLQWKDSVEPIEFPPSQKKKQRCGSLAHQAGWASVRSWHFAHSCSVWKNLHMETEILIEKLSKKQT